MLVGWGAEPRIDFGYQGCDVQGNDVWNPVEVLTHIDRPTVFHNLANLMKKDPKTELWLVFD